MLIYRVIPSLKKEYFYYEDPKTQQRCSLLEDGYGGYPVGTVLNELLNLYFGYVLNKLEGEVAEAKYFTDDYLNQLNISPLFREVLRSICAISPERLSAEDKEMMITKQGTWNPAYAKWQIGHILNEFYAYQSLVETVKTPQYRNAIFKEVREPASDVFHIADNLESDEEILRAIQVGYYACLEGLCIEFEENRKTLCLTDRDIEFLRSRLTLFMTPGTYPREALIEMIETLLDGFALVLEYARPRLNADPLFDVLEGTIYELKTKTTPENMYEKRPHLLDIIANDNHYRGLTNSIRTVQKEIDSHFIDAFDSFQFYRILFGEVRLLLLQMAEAASDETRGAILEEYWQGKHNPQKTRVLNDEEYPRIKAKIEEILEPRKNIYFVRTEWLTAPYISTAFKANLSGTTFAVKDLIDLYAVLCHGVNLAEVTPITCARCGKPFFPPAGKNAIKYCDNIDEITGVTCSDYAKHHRVKKGKRDPNDIKHRTLRKAETADRNEWEDASKYFKKLAEFIEVVGPQYRNSQDVSAELYEEWLSYVSALSGKAFNQAPNDAPYYLIRQGKLIDSREKFNEQLATFKEYLSGRPKAKDGKDRSSAQELIPISESERNTSLQKPALKTERTVRSKTALRTVVSSTNASPERNNHAR